MATLPHRIKVSNDRSSFATLWLEPWGEDYLMSPGDEFEVVAVDAEEGFYFHLAYDEKGIQVYAEGVATRVSVYQNSKLLSCGYSRLEET